MEQILFTTKEQESLKAWMDDFGEVGQIIMHEQPVAPPLSESNHAVMYWDNVSHQLLCSSNGNAFVPCGGPGSAPGNPFGAIQYNNNGVFGGADVLYAAPYGLDPGNTAADNTTAMNDVLAQLELQGGGTLIIPHGEYSVNTINLITVSSVIQGEQGTTLNIQPGETALTIGTPEPVVIRGIQFNGGARGILVVGNDVFPITVVNQGTKTFTISGDHVAAFTVGPVQLFVRHSTANDGTYTIVSVTLVAGNTEIVVSQSIPDATADGDLAPPSDNGRKAEISDNVFTGQTVAAVDFNAQGNQWGFRRNVIDTAPGIGLLVNVGTDSCECFVTDNTFAFNVGGSLRWQGGGNIRILDNKFLSNTGFTLGVHDFPNPELYFHNIGAGTSEIVIVGNVVSNGVPGIKFDGPSPYGGVVITGNNLNNAEYEVPALIQTDVVGDMTISGNTGYGASTFVKILSGTRISVFGNTLSALLDANTFRGTADTHTSTTVTNFVYTGTAGLTGTEHLIPGMAVTGSGVPAHTVIVSVDSATQITLSKPTTSTLVGTTLVIGVPGIIVEASASRVSLGENAYGGFSPNVISNSTLTSIQSVNTWAAMTAAELPEFATYGSQVLCSDCDVVSPCIGGSIGNVTARMQVGGAWNCGTAGIVGTTGQIAYFGSTNAITGDAQLTWNAANFRFNNFDSGEVITGDVRALAMLNSPAITVDGTVASVTFSSVFNSAVIGISNNSGRILVANSINTDISTGTQNAAINDSASTFVGTSASSTIDTASSTFLNTVRSTIMASQSSGITNSQNVMVLGAAASTITTGGEAVILGTDSATINGGAGTVTKAVLLGGTGGSLTGNIANAVSLNGGVGTSSNTIVYAHFLQSNGLAFASLGTPLDGTMIWCTDCTQTTPCAGGGGGAFAFREGGAWNCGGTSVLTGSGATTRIAVWDAATDVTGFSDFTWDDANLNLDIGGNTVAGAFLASLIGGGNNAGGGLSTNVFAHGINNVLTTAINAGAWGVSNSLSNTTTCFAVGSSNTITASDSQVFGESNSIVGCNDCVAVGQFNTLTSGGDGYAFGEFNVVDNGSGNNMALGQANTIGGAAGSAYAIGKSNTISANGVTRSMVLGHNNSTSHATAYLFGSNLVGTVDSSIGIGLTSTATELLITAGAIVAGGGTTITEGSVIFTALAGSTNGTVVYCTDCDPTATLLACTHVGAQTGAFAYRVNGAWKCIG